MFARPRRIRHHTAWHRHGTDTAGHRWDGLTRGGPLHLNDEQVCRALAESAHLTGTVALARVRARCLDAAVYDGADVRIHADRMPAWNQPPRVTVLLEADQEPAMDAASR
ncbi:MAG TPA: hypothetical protein VHM65_05615 [Candidatus Lustribacter sp.]|nr:hypothetical protein [Candidatus Lustribacter sp.]